jgi:hypothetical protein
LRRASAEADSAGMVCGTVVFELMPDINTLLFSSTREGRSDNAPHVLERDVTAPLDPCSEPESGNLVFHLDCSIWTRF